MTIVLPQAQIDMRIKDGLVHFSSVIHCGPLMWNHSSMWFKMPKLPLRSHSQTIALATTGIKEGRK